MLTDKLIKNFKSACEENLLGAGTFFATLSGRKTGTSHTRGCTPYGIQFSRFVKSLGREEQVDFADRGAIALYFKKRRAINAGSAGKKDGR